MRRFGAMMMSDGVTDREFHPPVPALLTGLRCRCPRCGQGRLFKGFLDLEASCDVCGLDYSCADAGDGPAVFVILIAGFLVCGGALLTEVMYSPPYWLQALIWLPLTVIIPLALLRPFKAILVALQYKNKAAEGKICK
ncbi:MAG: DUF983 domain-containing protein [Hyphomicrobiales bacterium]|nr:DUF983 domain-containing protein [Hyphomicrobiales bacterium]